MEPWLFSSLLQLVVVLGLLIHLSLLLRPWKSNSVTQSCLCCVACVWATFALQHLLDTCTGAWCRASRPSLQLWCWCSVQQTSLTHRAWLSVHLTDTSCPQHLHSPVSIMTQIHTVYEKHSIFYFVKNKLKNCLQMSKCALLQVIYCVLHILLYFVV